MNNNILNEIKRVREVMGITTQNVISEQVSPKVLTAFLKSLGYRFSSNTLSFSKVSKSLMDNQGIANVFKDDNNLWKKYAKDFDDVVSNDSFVENLTSFGDNPRVQKIITELLMTNRDTREVILKYLLPKDGMSPEIYLSSIKRKNTIETLNKMGVIITEKDLVKVLDDIYYPGGRGKWTDGITTELNPIAKAVKDVGNLPKNLFFKGSLKSVDSSKGEVLTKFIKKYAYTPEDVADVLVSLAGMGRREANKVRLALERGDIVEDVDFLKKLWINLSLRTDQTVREEFIKSIIDNKYFKNLIQTGGLDGKLMDKEEIIKLLGVNDEVADILSRNINKKGASPTSKVGQVLNDKVFPPFKWIVNAPGSLRRWAMTGKMHWSMRIFRIWVVYLIMPTFFLESLVSKSVWGRAMLDWFRGELPTGKLVNCLKPDARMQDACDSPSYISLFLKNDPACNNQMLDKACKGVASNVYYEAAKKIAIELGTYREVVEEITEKDIDAVKKIIDKENGKDKDGVELLNDKNYLPGTKTDPGWYDGPSTSGLESFWGTVFWSTHNTNEATIKNILNKRGSTFGIAKIATEYFKNAKRDLWSDMDLMSVQGYFGAGYYNKIIKHVKPGLDDSKEVLLDIKKSFYTWGDGNVAIDNFVGISSQLKWKFPERLYGATGSESWKPCYKGIMPINLQVFFESCADGSCNRDGIPITKESDMGKISAQDYNAICRKRLGLGSDLYNIPMKGEGEEMKYSYNGSTTYACKGQSRPAEWDQELKEVEAEFKDFKDYVGNLKEGNRKKIIGLERILKS
tara:strand:- start:458 stop:2854 length:2397 start_codon:yes stop_codon:yes gene_type:complete